MTMSMRALWHRAGWCVLLIGALGGATAAEAAEPTPASSAAAVIRVGPGRPLQRIADAARQAVDGSVVEVDAGDYVGDVAVWDLARVTIRGVGGRVRLVAAGAHAQGKAIWVVRRGQVTVEHIEFVGARVPDRNGAGIRLERGHLIVRDCRFLDSETGILTGNDGDTRLEVEGSEFGRLGAGDGQSHGIYVGAIASFRLSGSWVHHAKVGHLVKSRARVNRIDYNHLIDDTGGSASYELEFPNGGVADVVGNIVQQGAGTHNAVIVSYGAEGYRWADNRLRLVHNTVVNGLASGGSFVRVAPGAPGGAVVLSRNNLYVGPGSVGLPAAADAAGDHRADPAWFAQASSGDYRLSAQGRAALSAAALAAVEAGLAPRAQPARALRPEPLTEPLRWPGAVQAGAP